MRRLGMVLTGLGAAGVGVGLFALLDVYWRQIGVALGYPPPVSGLVGSGLLAAGAFCLLAAHGTTPRDHRAPEGS
jgi:hypothetical protein